MAEEEKRKASSPRKGSDEEVAKAISEAHGNISVAAKILTKQGHRYTRSGLLKRIQRSDALSEARADADAAICDLAEWKVLQKVNEGDLRACFFILEHRDVRYKPTVSVEEAEAKPRRSAKELEELLAKRGWTRIEKTKDKEPNNGEGSTE